MVDKPSQNTTSSQKWAMPATAAGIALTFGQPFPAKTDSMTQAQPKMAYAASDPTAWIAQAEKNTDLKLELAEAKSETKFVQLIGKLDLMVGSIADLKIDVKALDTKIDTVDGHTRAAKRDILTAIVSAALAVSALAWAGVQIYQSSIGIGMEAAKTAAEAKRK